MKILKQPIFYTSVLLAFIMYVAQKLQLPFPNWMYFYINDFLCMPIVLGICLSISRLIKPTKTLYVPISVVLALTVYFAIFFEWIMPQINTRYTYDSTDIALYFLSAILFFSVQKKLF